MKQALSGARIFTGEEFLDDHSLILNDGVIEAITPTEHLDSSVQVHQLSGGILTPGFIDIQVNGGGDVMFNNDPSVEGLARMMAGHRRFGTTGMMPTLISDTHDTIKAGVDAVNEARKVQVPGILGVHIEGPFFNPAKRGTHQESCIRAPEETDIDWLCSLRNPDSIDPLKAIVTLAPEQTATGQIKRLSDAGILVCAGHTDAYAADITRALNEGLKGFTHLFNAMRPLQGREPGVVGAALDDPNSWCGIIADGHHVDPMAIRIACAAKPEGKVVLVTDSMATIGGTNKSFTLYNEVITESEGKLINAEGNLAGSAIGMIDAVRISVEKVGLTLERSLRMASLYPAEFLGLAHCYGKTIEGYSADLVHFDEQSWQVKNTWIQGQHETH